MSLLWTGPHINDVSEVVAETDTPEDGGPIAPDGRYAVVTFSRQWLGFSSMKVVADNIRWMAACKMARQLVSERGCRKVWIVLKMRKYTNPGEVRQSFVELARRHNG